MRLEAPGENGWRMEKDGAGGDVPYYYYRHPSESWDLRAKEARCFSRAQARTLREIPAFAGMTVGWWRTSRRWEEKIRLGAIGKDVGEDVTRPFLPSSQRKLGSPSARGAVLFIRAGAYPQGDPSFRWDDGGVVG